MHEHPKFLRDLSPMGLGFLQFAFGQKYDVFSKSTKTSTKHVDPFSHRRLRRVYLSACYSPVFGETVHRTSGPSWTGELVRTKYGARRVQLSKTKMRRVQLEPFRAMGLGSNPPHCAHLRILQGGRPLSI